MIGAENDGGREGEGDGIMRLDPFLQPPILKAFFEVLPLKELARCRLVCKLWYEMSLSTWRSNATLNFGKEGIVSTRKDDGSTRLLISLEDFCDLWDAGDWASCPFRKFWLHWWDFKAGNVEQQRFLELVGCHITSLALSRCSFDERENFRRIIYQAFPKLQFLTIDWCGVENQDDPTEEVRAYKEPTFGVHELRSLKFFACPSNRLPESMMDMLSHFHKIRSLKLSGVDLGYRNLLEIIQLIREQDQTKLPLKNLDVGVVGSPQQGTRLLIELVKLHEQLDLPLQHLQINLEPEEDMDWNFNDVIRDILQIHSSTLKDLVVSGEEEGRDRHGLSGSFPHGFSLENLEFVAITLCFTKNLNYLKYTPNLRVLSLGARSFSLSESDNLFSNSTQLDEIEDWKLPTLTELNLSMPLSVLNMKKLMKWMPNVKRLTVNELDDVKFSMVCEHWSKLEYLMDLGNELTDSGLIGTRNGHEAGGDEQTQIRPNITKLTNLTSFQTGSSKLTSASVHKGFLKLDNLEFLAFLTGSKIDHEGKAALEKKPKLRLYDPHSTSRDRDYHNMYYFKLPSISSSVLTLLTVAVAVFFWFYLN